jgi:hypothetical protein
MDICMFEHNVYDLYVCMRVETSCVCEALTQLLLLFIFWSPMCQRDVIGSMLSNFSNATMVTLHVSMYVWRDTKQR